mmetsp:Transcript_53897/g.92750  ORF Transcript_53897/g.92750 Transcript_53897/m.92750 type:complete len:81 (+) Transcript_53897:317-559(+)
MANVSELWGDHAHKRLATPTFARTHHPTTHSFDPFCVPHAHHFYPHSNGFCDIRVCISPAEFEFEFKFAVKGRGLEFWGE